MPIWWYGIIAIVGAFTIYEYYTYTINLDKRLDFLARNQLSLSDLKTITEDYFERIEGKASRNTEALIELHDSLKMIEKMQTDSNFTLRLIRSHLNDINIHGDDASRKRERLIVMLDESNSLLREILYKRL
jgi:hypothetical protein